MFPTVSPSGLSSSYKLSRCLDDPLHFACLISSLCVRVSGILQISNLHPNPVSGSRGTQPEAELTHGKVIPGVPAHTSSDQINCHMSRPSSTKPGLKYFHHLSWDPVVHKMAHLREFKEQKPSCCILHFSPSLSPISGLPKDWRRKYFLITALTVK